MKLFAKCLLILAAGAAAVYLLRSRPEPDDLPACREFNPG